MLLRNLKIILRDILWKELSSISISSLHIMHIFYLVLFMSCIHRNAGHSTKRAVYEKQRDKKVIGATRYLEKKNLFQCMNHCQKISSCKVFNFNSGFQICEITDKRTIHSEDDVTVSKGWEVFLEVMKETTPEVIDFKINLENTIKMDFNFTMTDFSVCFWFQYYSNQTRTDHSLIRLVTDTGCPVFDIYLATNTYLTVIMGNAEEHKLYYSFETNKFYHVCYVHSSNFARWYHDGEAMEFSSNNYKVHAKHLLIGQYSDDCNVFVGAFQKGVLFDLNIFKKALNPSEVKLVMKRQITVPPIISWEDVKQKFGKFSTIEFKKIHIPKIENRSLL